MCLLDCDVLHNYTIFTYLFIVLQSVKGKLIKCNIY